LAKNKAQYDAFAQGKSLYTQDDVNADVAKAYPGLDPKFIPQVGDKGIMVTPQEKADLEEHGVFNAQVEEKYQELKKTDPVKASSFKLMARMKDTQGMNMILSLGKMGTIPEPGTGRRIMTVNGQPVGYMDEMFHQHLNTGDNSATPLIKDWEPASWSADPNSRKELRSAVNKFASDPNVKGYTTALDNIQYIEDAVKKNTPGSSINIRARLEQAAGGVPASKVSSTLLQSEGYSKAWSDQMAQWLQTGSKGTFTPANQKNILDQAESEKQLKRSQLLTKVKAEADNAQAMYGLHPDFAASVFTKPVEQYVQSATKVSPQATQMRDAITAYLTAKKLPTDDTHIQSVVNQIKNNPQALQNLVTKYGQ
jgi:hypothetical protein